MKLLIVQNILLINSHVKACLNFIKKSGTILIIYIIAAIIVSSSVPIKSRNKEPIYPAKTNPN